MHPSIKTKLIHFSRQSALSILCGILAGTAAAAFLKLLDAATEYRLMHPALVWGLPLAGLVMGWAYYRFGQEILGGNQLIVDEIHQARRVIPLRMAPMIFISTIVTHLFGGSAGREGSAVQMGASLGDQLTRLFKLEAKDRKILLAAGAGAGFGAAVGAPFAGAIFGMEVIYIGRLRLFAWYECFVASWIAYGTLHGLGADHPRQTPISLPSPTIKILVSILAAAVVFGMAARVFSTLTHSIEKNIKQWIAFPPLRPALGGILLLCFFAWEGSLRYAGLGIAVIQESLHSIASMRDPILKMIASALTVGSGFKGGEFIPLVFIGSSLGSALSSILPVSTEILAKLGYAAVFAGAANTPLACSLMAMELFGYELAPYALLACYTSYLCSGYHGIYRTQVVYQKKFSKLIKLARKLIQGLTGGKNQ